MLKGHKCLWLRLFARLRLIAYFALLDLHKTLFSSLTVSSNFIDEPIRGKAVKSIRRVKRREFSVKSINLSQTFALTITVLKSNLLHSIKSHYYFCQHSDKQNSVVASGWTWDHYCKFLLGTISAQTLISLLECFQCSLLVSCSVRITDWHDDTVWQYNCSSFSDI